MISKTEDKKQKIETYSVCDDDSSEVYIKLDKINYKTLKEVFGEGLE